MKEKENKRVEGILFEDSASSYATQQKNGATAENVVAVIDDALLRKTLKENWGYDDFRGIQLDIIRNVVAGNDTLGLMPTGGGKSITFQVPALLLDGMTIVVTPLIALMKDQVEHLCQRGIRAAAIYSGMSRQEILQCLDNAVYGGYKFLYVSPERLSTDIFRTKVQRMKVSFITVDEAHCISQWGYDFRPSYLGIFRLRELLINAPVLALTATATPKVVEDICLQLRFRKGHSQVFKMSFARRNLRYIVRKAENKNASLLHILNSLSGSAIVYTRSRGGTTDTARFLKENGISAINYHAGLTDIDKDVRQRAWQEGDIRVMVATNAFGMGIDKADVRLVVHLDLPDSVEAYFQEAGRAGRDGNTAFAVLLYNNLDHGKMLRRVPETFPEKRYISDVYDKLAFYFQLPIGEGANHTFEFSLEKFCRSFHLFPVPVVSSLNILTRAGYIVFKEADESVSRLMFICRRDELYRISNLPSDVEAIVQDLLRNYTGVFSDYAAISEKRISYDLGISEDTVYESLKTLSRQRIIHYIPRKNVPRITYIIPRVDIGKAWIPKEVYEVRRADYVQRINAILGYAANERICRSRYLLEYFGDDHAVDCGHCDVCLARRDSSSASSKSYKELADKFLNILSDKKPHRPSDLVYNGYTDEIRDEALSFLVEEEKITLRDGMYFLKE